jgi:hypothetical protein
VIKELREFDCSGHNPGVFKLMGITQKIPESILGWLYSKLELPRKNSGMFQEVMVLALASGSFLTEGLFAVCHS